MATPGGNWPVNAASTSCIVVSGGGVSCAESIRSTLTEAINIKATDRPNTTSTTTTQIGLHTYGLPPDPGVKWNIAASTGGGAATQETTTGLSRDAISRLRDLANSVTTVRTVTASQPNDTCVIIPVEESNCRSQQQYQQQIFTPGPPVPARNKPTNVSIGSTSSSAPFHSVQCNVAACSANGPAASSTSFVPNSSQQNGGGIVHCSQSSNPFVHPMQPVPPMEATNAAGLSNPVTKLGSSTVVIATSDVSSVNVIQPASTVAENLINIRTLVSTDAQTDTSDLTKDQQQSNNAANGSTGTTNPARPNREVRKRERRERRRDRNGDCRHSTSSATSSSHRHHQHHQRRHVPTSHNHSLIENYANILSGRSSCAGVESRPSSSVPVPNSTPEDQQQLQMDQLEVPQTSTELVPSTNNIAEGEAVSTDMLNPHVGQPPMYSTLPPNYDRRLAQVPLPLPIISMPMVSNAPPGSHMQIPMQIPLPPHTASALLVQPPSTCIPAQAQPTVRYHFPAATRASRRSVGPPRGVPFVSEEEPQKACCGISATTTVSMRWFIVVIAIIGISCTVAGTALGAAYSNGREQLTYSLLMIGVGVVLLTVSAVAWRITSHEAESSCRAMFGFTRSGGSRADGGTESGRRFMPRLTPAYGRPHHPYAAMMYPEFQYRPPPPSYQASMQEYRLRLLLLERSNPSFTTSPAAMAAAPGSYAFIPPPPAYRPYSGGIPGVNHMNDPDYSRPPSYRSRSSGNAGQERALSRPSMDPTGGLHHALQHQVVIDSPLHSRNPSLLSYLSQQSVADNVSVVSGRNVGASDPSVVTVMRAVSVGMDLGIDMGLYDPDCIEHLPLEEDGKTNTINAEEQDVKTKDDENTPDDYNKDGNLVRIVQTTDSSQVIGRESVIVTVSGSNHALWNQSIHLTHSPQIHVQNSPVPSTNNALSPSESETNNSSNTSRTTAGSAGTNMQNVISTSEVQILAHL